MDEENRAQTESLRNSLVVQWLGLGAFTVESRGLMAGPGTKIPQATRHGKNKQTNKKQQQTPKTQNP